MAFAANAVAMRVETKITDEIIAKNIEKYLIAAVIMIEIRLCSMFFPWVNEAAEKASSLIFS